MATSTPRDAGPGRRWAVLAAGLALVGSWAGGPLAAPANAAPSAAQPPATYIVVFKDSVRDPAAQARAQQQAHGVRAQRVLEHAVTGYIGTMSPAAAAAVSKEPSVQFVTADRPFELADVNAPQILQPWNQRVGGVESSTRVGDGRGTVNVNAAVIDSGIDATHPDLNVRGGIDCTSGAPVPVTPTDPFGHGTFVAGVLGARDNTIGDVGVAPGTPLWSANVVPPSGEPSLAGLVCAVDWVTGTRQDRNPHNDIAVANISIEGDGADDGRCGLVNHDPLHLAICRSVATGVSYAVIAGNDASDLAGFVPGAYDEVLTATAMADFDGKPGGLAAADCNGSDVSDLGRDDQAATFSNYATTPRDELHTIAAPGVCLESTVPGGYTIADGTSFASPVLAGTLALCIQARRCRDGRAAANMARVAADTAAFNLRHRGYGYTGDPLRPIPGRYYGFLVSDSLY